MRHFACQYRRPVVGTYQSNRECVQLDLPMAAKKRDAAGNDAEDPLISGSRDEWPASPTNYWGLAVTTPVFMGYAACVILQHQLKETMGVDDKNSHDYKIFTHAVSFNYIGNLIFRLAHNVVFARFKPRQRVFISLSAMCIAMTLLGVVICLGKSRNLAWIFVAYFLCGVSVGTYESNMISCITPLGHESKVWTIIGMPLGFNLISIGGQALLSADFPLPGLYIIVLSLCITAMMVMMYMIPNREIPNNSNNLAEVRENIGEWRAWLPLIKWHCAALMVDMWAVSFFSAIMFYILSEPNVSMFGMNHTSWIVDKHAYFAVFNCFTFIGDSMSRKLIYHMKRLRHPWLYLLCAVVGAALLLSDIPLLGPLGMFLVFFCNGAVYATSTKYIDTHVDKRYNLVALSVWLFIGDIGSVIGSNSWQEIQPRICTEALKKSQYFCNP